MKPLNPQGTVYRFLSLRMLRLTGLCTMLYSFQCYSGYIYIVSLSYCYGPVNVILFRVAIDKFKSESQTLYCQESVNKHGLYIPYYFVSTWLYCVFYFPFRSSCEQYKQSIRKANAFMTLYSYYRNQIITLL